MHDASYKLLWQFSVGVMPDAVVLDVGALDVNGNLRELFGSGYIGCDLVAGPNVDLVLSDPYTIPMKDGSVDVIVSANSFEHVAMPWKLVLELDRILRPGGVIAVSAPWVFPWHHLPDFWRYSPDAFATLFGDWMIENGRGGYRINHNFIDSPMPDLLQGCVDTYFEGRKP